MPFGFGRSRLDLGSRGDRFTAAFAADAPAVLDAESSGESGISNVLAQSGPRFAEFLRNGAPASYDRGLFRLLLPRGNPNLLAFNDQNGWTSEWPEMRGLEAFAYDWLGRLFVVDGSGSWTRSGTVVRVSPGTGEVESPTSKPTGIDEYVFDVLPKQKREALSADYFEDWLASGGRPLGPTECVGYRVPLVLGGEDDIPNLEVTDLEVYLSASGQIHAQLADVSDVTSIDRIRFAGQ